MGASPKTKADYLKKIERATNTLKVCQNNVISMKKAGNKQGALNWQMKVNQTKADIALLKEKMKQAPKA